jgi:hypothetical protein
MILSIGILLFLSNVQAQTTAPGQVKMQIPLGNQQPAARPAPGKPPHPAAAAPAPGGLNPSLFPFPTGQNVPAAPVSQVFTSDTGVDSLLTEELIRSLRDPFVPPVSLTRKQAPKSDLELFALKDVRLNGVITGPKKVRAMISVPGNKTYFVAVGDKLGMRDGRITSIQSDLIKVVEYEVDNRGRRSPEIFEVRITGEIVSLSKKEE